MYRACGSRPGNPWRGLRVTGAVALGFLWYPRPSCPSTLLGFRVRADVRGHDRTGAQPVRGMPGVPRPTTSQLPVSSRRRAGSCAAARRSRGRLRQPGARDAAQRSRDRARPSVPRRPARSRADGRRLRAPAAPARSRSRAPRRRAAARRRCCSAATSAGVRARAVRRSRRPADRRDRRCAVPAASPSHPIFRGPRRYSSDAHRRS